MPSGGGGSRERTRRGSIGGCPSSSVDGHGGDQAWSKMLRMKCSSTFLAEASWSVKTRV